MPVGAIPSVAMLISKESLEKWKEEWQNTKNGSETKQYFPTTTERLKIQINLTSELTTMLTGHGKLKSVLPQIQHNRRPTCICGGGSQTAHHLLYDCQLYSKERMQIKGRHNEEWRHMVPK